jgi:hypothetical protein
MRGRASAKVPGGNAPATMILQTPNKRNNAGKPATPGLHTPPVRRASDNTLTAPYTLNVSSSVPSASQKSEFLACISAGRVFVTLIAFGSVNSGPRESTVTAISIVSAFEHIRATVQTWTVSHAELSYI